MRNRGARWPAPRASRGPRPAGPRIGWARGSSRPGPQRSRAAGQPLRIRSPGGAPKRNRVQIACAAIALDDAGSSIWPSSRTRRSCSASGPLAGNSLKIEGNARGRSPPPAGRSASPTMPTRHPAMTSISSAAAPTRGRPKLCSPSSRSRLAASSRTGPPAVAFDVAEPLPGQVSIGIEMNGHREVSDRLGL